jgi:tetratricopeptide (TPR) repeat protein
MSKKERRRHGSSGRRRPDADANINRRPHRDNSRIWLALILVAGFLIYVPCLEYGFVFDDDNILQASRLPDSAAEAALAVVNPFSYRPVRDASYLLDQTVGGNRPVVFHLSNLLYHVLTLLAGWLVLRRVTRSRMVSAVALAFFAVHPVHLDAVVYISGRRDLLAALFTLLAFWAFLRFRDDRRAWWWLPAVIFFVLAYQSKEMGIVFPVLVLLYEWLEILAESNRPGFWRPLGHSLGQVLRRGYWYYLPLLALGGLLAGHTVLARTVSYKFTWWGGSVITNFLTVAKVVWYYVLLMVAPLTLQPDYSYLSFPIAFSAADLTGILALLALAVLIFWLVRLGVRGYFQWAFWSLWFFAALLPVAHIVPHHELMAEHYLYLPSLGFCAVSALGVRQLAHLRRTWAWAAGLAAAGFWLALGFLHMPVYSSDMNLVQNVLARSPQNVRANIYMGRHFLNRGNLPGALPYFQRVVALEPLPVREGLSPADIHRLWREHEMGRGEIGAGFGHTVDAYHKSFRILLEMGRRGAAVALCREAMAKYDILQNELGEYLLSTGDAAEAARCFQSALTSFMYQEDMLPLVHFNLARACLQLDQPGKARRHFHKAIHVKGIKARIAPEAHYQLAQIIIRQRRWGWREIGAFHLQAALRKGLTGEERRAAVRRELGELGWN